MRGNAWRALSASVPAACLLAASAAPVAGQRTTLGELLQDSVLPNGLQVLVVRSPVTPLATIQVTVRNGAFTQVERADEGIPHLLEHMLFRSYMGGDGFAAEANKLDAMWNGTTGYETVTYYLTLPSSNLDRGIRLLADLMRQPRFRSEDLGLERDVVRGELERQASDPSFLLRTAVERRLWGTGWSQRNTIGTIPSIAGATPARLTEVYGRYYVPDNTALVVTGDVDPAAAFASAARHFGRWTGGRNAATRPTPPALPPLASHAQVTVDADVTDVTLMVKWQGPGVRDAAAATYAADVFAALVNDPLSGFQERLVDSGLFQSVSMGYATLGEAGPITIHGLTTAEQLPAASAALRAELQLMGEPGYIDAEQVELAKKKRDVDWALFMDRPSSVASLVGELWSVAGLEYTRSYLASMQAQRVEDLEAFIATYLTDRPRVTGIMMSPDTRARHGAALQASLAHWRR